MCDQCGDPIADSDGYLTLHLDEVEAFRADRADHEAKVVARNLSENAATTLTLWRGEELLAMPCRAEWHVLHRRCDVRPDSTDDYCTGVERCRTYVQLLDWSLHLSAKRWFGSTNWVNFIYGRVPGVAWAA
jgi:hypothetical protein